MVGEIPLDILLAIAEIMGGTSDSGETKGKRSYRRVSTDWGRAASV